MRSESGARKDLFGLVSIFVEAGILEETCHGGYKVTIDVRALQQEVYMLRRKIAKLEAIEAHIAIEHIALDEMGAKIAASLGPQDPSSS